MAPKSFAQVSEYANLGDTVEVLKIGGSAVALRFVARRVFVNKKELLDAAFDSGRFIGIQGHYKGFREWKYAQIVESDRSGPCTFEGIAVYVPKPEWNEMNIPKYVKHAVRGACELFKTNLVSMKAVDGVVLFDDDAEVDHEPVVDQDTVEAVLAAYGKAAPAAVAAAAPAADAAAVADAVADAAAAAAADAAAAAAAAADADAAAAADAAADADAAAVPP
jgi:hypothetical protein